MRNDKNYKLQQNRTKHRINSNYIETKKARETTNQKQQHKLKTHHKLQKLKKQQQ